MHQHHHQQHHDEQQQQHAVAKMAGVDHPHHPMPDLNIGGIPGGGAEQHPGGDDGEGGDADGLKDENGASRRFFPR